MGSLSPSEFIPIAEEQDLLYQLVSGSLIKLVKRLSVYTIEGYNELKVSINISGIHFSQSNFVKDVSRIIRNTNMNTHLVELELTESMIMPNAKESIDELVNVKKNGMKLSIDDFGTGYSSLSYLKRFPIDTIKIDQSFIRNSTSHSDDALLLEPLLRWQSPTIRNYR